MEAPTLSSVPERQSMSKDIAQRCSSKFAHELAQVPLVSLSKSPAKTSTTVVNRRLHQVPGCW
jgi:hypothetical protein